MTKIFSRPIFYIALLAFIILGVWISYLPSRIAANIKTVVQDQAGRALTYRKSGYSFSPEFGIALQDVSLAGSATLIDPAVHAQSVLVPIGLSNLFGGQVSLQRFFADGADIHVAFDGVGHSNIFDGESPKSWPALDVYLSNSSLSYFDERSGDQFGIEQISSLTKFSGEGEINSSGSAVVHGQFVNFESTLASLERAFTDGSPLDLTVEGVASSFAFSGRIATDKRLNLAGLAELNSTDAQRLMKWLGADVSALPEFKTLSLSGALDSDGPVMLVRDAQLKIGSTQAKGDISFSNAGERPNITAALGLDNLDFTALFAPAAGSGTWSDKPIDFSGLNALDLQYRVAANSLTYGNFKTGTATVQGALLNRVLTAAVESQDVSGGAGRVDLKIDATQIPPKLKLDLALTNAAAEPLVSGVFNQRFLTGTLALNAQLTSIGSSMAEMISTLSGEANGALDGGALSGANLATLGNQALQGWNGGQTQSIKAQAQFKLQEGVATLGENQLDGAGVSLHSEGEIDLLRKSLDMTTGPDVKVKIQGSWANPTLTPQ